MKKFKNILITSLMLALILNSAYGQEYKIDASGDKTLKLMEVGKVSIVGYEGNEIVFSTEVKDNDASERAQGLSAISGMGLTDNSGIGLSVLDKGDVIEVNPMSKRSGPRYEIKVPRNVKIFYEHSTAYGSKFMVKDLNSEIEASTNHSSIALENVTGPMTVNTVHGNIEAVFGTVSQASPISIVSTHGHVDVALPSNTKANLKMRSTWGEIYTDLPIEFDANGESKSNSTKVSGTINGGGVTIDLSSSHSNIYLRTKK